MALTLLIVSCSEENENVNVPEVVKKSFTSQYPNVDKVEWGIENAGEYEAEFKLGKVEMSVVLDSLGAVLETETKIVETELPQAVKSALTKDFSGYKIENVVKANVKDSVFYEINVEKGKVESEIMFDVNGKLLKQQQENEETGENEEKD